jgi:hypothetical protein
MNILSIGNSFSEDATRYLHQIALFDNVEINTVNLYIGGCSLERHYRNILSEERVYELQYNGEKTAFYVSIKEALLNRNWDCVTFQQVSHQAVNYDAFCPYLAALSQYVKKFCPKAKQIIHQTWAYEQGSERLCTELGYKDYKDMLCDLKESYKLAKQEINACGIIKSGELFDLLLKNGLSKIHRDAFHASYGAGRYALGLLWYAYFTGNDVMSNGFNKFNEPIPEDEIKIIKTCVKKVLEEN